MNLTYGDPSNLSQVLSTNVQQWLYIKFYGNFPVIIKKKKQRTGSLQKITKPPFQQDTVSKNGVGLHTRITAYSTESGTFQTAYLYKKRSFDWQAANYIYWLLTVFQTKPQILWLIVILLIVSQCAKVHIQKCRAKLQYSECKCATECIKQVRCSAVGVVPERLTISLLKCFHRSVCQCSCIHSCLSTD